MDIKFKIIITVTIILIIILVLLWLPCSGCNLTPTTYDKLGYSLSSARMYPGVKHLTDELSFIKGTVFLSSDLQNVINRQGGANTVILECSSELQGFCLVHDEVYDSKLEILEDFSAKLSSCCTGSKFYNEYYCTLRIGEEEVSC